MQNDTCSPKDFLRARRPEKFSDSVALEKPVVDRGQVEYHLHSLTTRKQENEFEAFARALAQREICPNLTKQTGPTGGGDGKVDAETYPVADQLSLIWYTGVGREPAGERWGFAFSAKADWRSKLRSDIAKIAGTDRGYATAYFVTNQAVPSRTQAEVQDELRQEYGIDVRVIDREWILDRVFSKRHQDLLVEELGMSFDCEQEFSPGPNDFRRKGELDRLEVEIENRVQEGRLGPGLAEDCLHAAILSTQLELPSIETDGRFDRADRVAKDHGTPHQWFKVAYHRAWTSYWWREDFDLFVDLYREAAERADGTANPHELELMTNLWLLLHTASNTGQADIEAAYMQERTNRLKQQLEAMAADEQYASASLQARTHLALVDLHDSLQRREDVSAALAELEAVIRASEGLVGYPLAPLSQIVLEMGRLHQNEAYDRLFELVTKTMAAREEETTASRMLLDRGEQCLEADRPYDAIAYIGRSLGGLYKEETRHEEIRALYACACAYERVGLLWAARGTLLLAASLAMKELVQHDRATPELAICCGRIKWAELQLGRLAQALEWHQVDQIIRTRLVDSGYAEEPLFERDAGFDALLGILLLGADLVDLAQMSQLPDVLSELNLFASRAALLFALGHEDEARSAVEIPEEQETKDFFRYCLATVDPQLLPQQLLLGGGGGVQLRSLVLGCEINTVADNAGPYLELAESIMASVEAALATCAERGVWSAEPRLDIRIEASGSTSAPFDSEFLDNDGRPLVIISCRDFDPHSVNTETQATIRERLISLLAGIMGRLLTIDRPQPFLDELIGNERAFDRALWFTGSFVVLGNVLGCEPRVRVSDWSGEEHEEYNLLRDKTWDAALAPVAAAPAARQTRAQVDADERIVAHNKMRTKSLIRIPLWDRARWTATGYFWDSANTFPPVMAIVFADGESGDAIFRRLQEDIGDDDHDDLLRLSIIRGINREHPHWYRAVVGTNVDATELGRDEMAVFVSRINQMEPVDGSNLDQFLRRFNATGCYSLAPAVSRDRSIGFELLWGPQIVKYHLHVYQAWQIGRHDIEAVAISPDDDVMMPSEETEAPIIELQAWLRSR